MAKKAPRTKNKDNARRSKKKTSVLVQESVEYIDYKDINLLRRFMSDRAKIRARRVTGNDQQQQAAVARAIKLSREMALLPYSVRQVQQRTKGRGRDRRDADLQLETDLPSRQSEELEVTEGVEGGERVEGVEGVAGADGIGDGDVSVDSTSDEAQVEAMA